MFLYCIACSSGKMNLLWAPSTHTGLAVIKPLLLQHSWTWCKNSHAPLSPRGSVYPSRVISATFNQRDIIYVNFFRNVKKGAFLLTVRLYSVSPTIGFHIGTAVVGIFEMALINFSQALDMLYCSTSNPAGYIHIITWIQFNLCAFRPVTEPPVRLQLK